MTGHQLSDHGFELDDWLVEPRLGRMVRGQVVVRLRPRVAELLVLLAERAGEVVAKRAIVDRVWSSGFVADNTVVHCVKELRQLLGDTAGAARYLQTIPRRGYRLLATVRPLTEAPPLTALDGARCELAAASWTALLIDGDNLLGRGGESQIVIDSVRVSRHHARVTVSAQGAEIVDLGSKNGTFVKDHPIETAVQLADGDEVRLGDVRLEFRTRAAEPDGATVTME